MKNDKLVLAVTFFLNGLMISLFVKPWFFGLPIMALALFYLTEGLKKQEQSGHPPQDKNKTSH